MEQKPKYIFIENVKGFEESKTRGQLLEVLDICGMEYREFLLSPTQFGIPNSRLRYYLCAKLKSESGFVIPPSPTGKPITDLTDVLDSAHLVKDTRSTAQQLCNETPPSHQDVCQAECSLLPLSHFCQILSERESKKYLIPLKTVVKYISAMDIVTMADNHSCCFTKAYGHYIVGTGSILQQDIEVSLETCYSEYQKTLKEANIRKQICSKTSPGEAVTGLSTLLPCCLPENSGGNILSDCSTPQDSEGTYAEGMLNWQEEQGLSSSQEGNASLLQDNEVMQKAAACLAPLQLRYFTEREIANLHCYPQDFSFPAALSLHQRCRAMGNSLNVHVVATLMRLFLFDSHMH